MAFRTYGSWLLNTLEKKLPDMFALQYATNSPAESHLQDDFLSSSSPFLQAESVLGLQHVGITTGLVNLLAAPHPLRMVDTINVVLDLEHDAAVPGNGTGELAALDALGLLERHGAVLAAARVHLEGVLVGVHVELDAGPV